MAAILQTTFSNTFSSMKLFEILMKISLKFVPKVPIDNKPALVQIMACRLLSKPMIAYFTDAYMHHSALVI